jgi:hypothetical protein
MKLGTTSSTRRLNGVNLDMLCPIARNPQDQAVAAPFCFIPSEMGCARENPSDESKGNSAE